MAAFLAVFCVGVGNANAQVPSGTDCWETDPGTTAGIPNLPAGFFFPGSNPFFAEQIDVVGVPLGGAELADCACEVDPETEVIWVDIHGDPVEPDSRHRVTQIPPGAVDTCVRRLADANFPGGAGVPESVPIELVQLHLESVVPIVVGGPGPNLWNVKITEDGVQATGTLVLTPAVLVPAPAGAMDLTDLPVDFLIEFTPVGGGALPTGLGGLTLNFQNPNGTFQVAQQVPVLGPAGPIAVGLVIVAGFAWIVRQRYLAA